MAAEPPADYYHLKAGYLRFKGALFDRATGLFAYPYLFDLLDRLGYAGWVGCEYRPATTTTAGLGWLPQPA